MVRYLLPKVAKGFRSPLTAFTYSLHLDTINDYKVLVVLLNPNNETKILIDSGYFVGRQKKHWSPRGTLKRAWRSYKTNKTNWFQFQYKSNKAIKGDISYCEVVMSRMKSNPKYDKTCEAILCFDGIKGRQLRGKIFDEYKSGRNKGLEVKAYKRDFH